MHTNLYKLRANKQRARVRRREEYLDAMLKTVKLPASISDLNTGLTNVDRNALSHFRFEGNSTTKKLKKKLTEALTVKRRRLSRRLLIWVKTLSIQKWNSFDEESFGLAVFIERNNILTRGGGWDKVDDLAVCDWLLR